MSALSNFRVTPGFGVLESWAPLVAAAEGVAAGVAWTAAGTVAGAGAGTVAAGALAGLPAGGDAEAGGVVLEGGGAACLFSRSVKGLTAAGCACAHREGTPRTSDDRTTLVNRRWRSTKEGAFFMADDDG